MGGQAGEVQARVEPLGAQAADEHRTGDAGNRRRCRVAQRDMRRVGEPDDLRREDSAVRIDDHQIGLRIGHPLRHEMHATDGHSRRGSDERGAAVGLIVSVTFCGLT